MPLAACLRALLALALLCGALCAQDKRVFDAGKELPGFEAASLSEWNELYGCDSFKAQDGKELAAAEIEELRARWKSAQESAQKRITAIEADPRERAFWQLERRLARHGYFSKIAYTLERPEPGIVMVLQRPAKDDPGYAARIGGFYLPFVRKMAANFDALVAKPAALVRRQGFEITAFAVLASKGDLENFERFVKDASGFTDGTCYDYALQLAVTYEDPFANGVSVVAQHSELLYQLARELQHAHLSVVGNRPGSIWLSEGLSILLATHEGASADSLDKRALRPDATACLARVLAQDELAPLLLFSADELAALRSFDEYRAAVGARAKRLHADPPEEALVARAFFAQCELWAHYLLDGARGAYRKPWALFQKSAFAGRGGAEELRNAFSGMNLANLSRDFLRWVAAEHERVHADEKVNTLPIDTLFAENAAAGAAPSAAAPPARVPEGFAPAMLAPDADDAEAQFALALADAREGDLEGAAAGLDALAAVATAAPWPERLAREKARFAELAKLREGYLAYLVASGAKLALKHKGKDLFAPVTGVENGLVKLGDNKLGLPSVPLSEVDPYEIAKVASKKEMQGEAQPWARFYAYAIANDARWEKLLKDDSPAAKELREDAREYPALVRTAQAARELFALSKLPLPRDEKEAQARLDRIKALLGAGSGSALVEHKLEPLRQLATACLVEQSRKKGATALLHGKWTELGEGRGRLVYEFDDVAEGADWIQVPGGYKGDRASMEKIGYTDADTKFAPVKGALRGVGSGFFRHAARFDGPVTLRYSFRYEDLERAYVTPRFYWVLCDDGHESAYMSAPGGELYVEDLKRNDSRRKLLSDQARFDFGKDWSIEFSFDGKQLASKLEGAPRNSMPAAKLAAGHVGFVVHSELPVLIARVEIEGRIDPNSIADLDRVRIAQELKKLGFP